MKTEKPVRIHTRWVMTDRLQLLCSQTDVRQNYRKQNKLKYPRTKKQCKIKQEVRFVLNLFLRNAEPDIFLPVLCLLI